MSGILVIRGGAIGDFILTLPSLRALRDASPTARLEILGYKHIAALAGNRFYADAVRSIEYAPLSSLFVRGGEISSELREYFGGFDLIVSYLYDPDEICVTNLKRCGPGRVVVGPGKIEPAKAIHASRQLAEPLAQLGIKVNDFAAKIFPSPADRQFAAEFLRETEQPAVAIHPGSGSEKKNWPIERWIELAKELSGIGLIVVGGEADQLQLARLAAEWKSRPIVFARDLPLPQVAAIIERVGVFIGHDSGISHLAAAVGARCTLLFSATDPKIWAPIGENVRVLRAASQRIDDIDVAAVVDTIKAGRPSGQ